MPRRLLVLAAVAFGLASVAALESRWHPDRAARYLDHRLDQWSRWKPAASPDGPCVSCHTGMTYLLARPALRQRLGESEPTVHEQALLRRLRANVGEKPESYLQGVETVFAAFFLTRRQEGRPLDTETRKAFDQLWALQLRDGASAGSWEWLKVDLDPWEHSESEFFGAALAALAVGQAGAAYAGNAAVASQVTALTAYLRTPPSARRPLHDRVALLWASSQLPALLPSADRQALLAELLGKQAPDGGWTLASLGPWTPHPNAPPAAGSDAYATGFVTYVLQRAGLGSSDPRLDRALTWLATHQDPETGAWVGASMNKRYPVGSMESLFMQDAATALASLALIEAGR
jgi:squalene-hopene/tetraprenyl-beta-curcumene cyclase